MSVKIGIAGPVGSGKTSIIEQLTNILKDKYSLGIVTNDIYTTEDANYLKSHLDLESERIVGVETGGCPHTAIRDDISANQKAIEDYYMYVIDVAQGADIPRKKGAGLLFSDLLVVNKTDLAPHVEIDLESMENDVKENRKNKPYLFLSKKDESIKKLEEWIEVLV